MTPAEQLFNQIMQQHTPLISKVCYMYATDTEHFKDLTQEVAANIWCGLDSFRAESKASTWIYRVAINTCVSFYRRNKRHEGALPLDSAGTVAIDNADAEHREQLAMMYRLISDLGKIDRALIMLWLDEKSYDEMAEITGLTRANVASRLHRARARLTLKAQQL